MTNLLLAMEIERLVQAAQPNDGSAPLQPALDLATLVLAYQSMIVTALRRDYA